MSLCVPQQAVPSTAEEEREAQLATQQQQDEEELKRRFRAIARQRFLSAREAHLLDAEV